MGFKTSWIYTQAIDIVKAGLQSGSIKLLGTNGSPSAAAKHAAADAEYINALINDVVKNLSTAKVDS